MKNGRRYPVIARGHGKTKGHVNGVGDTEAPNLAASSKLKLLSRDIVLAVLCQTPRQEKDSFEFPVMVLGSAASVKLEAFSAHIDWTL